MNSRGLRDQAQREEEDRAEHFELKSRRRRSGWLLGCLVALVLGAMVLGGVVSVFDDESGPVATIPSPTPYATSTPTPSARCETDEVVQYVTEIQPHLDDLIIALAVIGVLWEEAVHDPDLLLDETWQDSVALQMVTMGWLMAHIEDQMPPPILAGSHNLLLMAFDEYHLFVQTYIRAINGRLGSGPL